MYNTQAIYAHYVSYCATVGHLNPPSYAFWLLLSNHGGTGAMRFRSNQ